jgi:hypothetical protein
LKNTRKSDRRTRLKGWFLWYLAPRPAALALLMNCLPPDIANPLPTVQARDAGQRGCVSDDLLQLTFFNSIDFN